MKSVVHACRIPVKSESTKYRVLCGAQPPHSDSAVTSQYNDGSSEDNWLQLQCMLSIVYSPIYTERTIFGRYLLFGLLRIY